MTEAENKENVPLPDRHSGKNELDTVVEAGRILMGSGAEIYRIEDTMTHIAAALQVDDFEAYVVNRGIFASGTNNKGVQEAKITSIPETSVHLGRIEAVNSLSREIYERHDMPLEEIASRLQEIRKETVDPLWAILLTYFIGAASFSLAIGSTWRDSIASSICGLVMGLVLYFVEDLVHTRVLKTIIGSAIVTIFANLLYQLGLGDHRGLIILGGFMLLVPGAVFTRSVREFSENNYTTGLTLLMAATLTCLAMAAGVVVATEFLPFADQMTDVFSGSIKSTGDILLRTVMAGIGTVAFAFLFHSPKKYYLDQGFLGAVSWLLYLIMNMLFHTEVLSIFTPALAVTLLSRFLAVRRKCPVTVFLSTSIFPLIPGLSFYRGVYFLITGSEILGWTYMQSCFISAFAIAIAISVVQQIPAGFFRRLAN